MLEINHYLLNLNFTKNVLAWLPAPQTLVI